MTVSVVLDSAGLDALAGPRPPELFRALLAEAWQRDVEVVVPAAVCAEVCRGVGRTRAVETAISRSKNRQRQRPAVRVVAMDFALAKQTGAILEATGSGSADLVDASVVAVCVRAGGGLVVTSDADDINRLAQAVPQVRIVTRAPEL